MNVIFFLAFVVTFLAIGVAAGIHYAEHRDVDALGRRETGRVARDVSDPVVVVCARARALVGIGDGIIQAKLVYPDSTAEVVAMEKKAATATLIAPGAEKPATPPAPAANPH